VAFTLDSSGTQTAVIGTEHSLATSTNNGLFVFEVDMTNLAAGEVVELRVKGITLTGGAVGQMWKATYQAPLPNVRVRSVGDPSDISITVTLKQVSGTGRAFPWKLLRT
jgi:hypothetical protein